MNDSQRLLLSLLILVSTLTIACEEVYFAQPQPANGKTLTEFPPAWRGAYYAVDPETYEKSAGELLFVGKSEVIMYARRIDSLPVAQVETRDWVGEDSLRLRQPDGDRVVRAWQEGEWVRTERIQEDRIGLADSLVLRHHPELGYFLNLPEKKGDLVRWTSLYVEWLRNDDCMLWGLFGKEHHAKAAEYFDLRTVEGAPERSEYVLADPDLAALKAYVEAQGFPALAAFFHRISNEDLMRAVGTSRANAYLQFTRE